MRLEEHLVLRLSQFPEDPCACAFAFVPVGLRKRCAMRGYGTGRERLAVLRQLSSGYGNGIVGERRRTTSPKFARWALLRAATDRPPRSWNQTAVRAGSGDQALLRNGPSWRCAGVRVDRVTPPPRAFSRSMDETENLFHTMPAGWWNLSAVVLAGRDAPSGRIGTTNQTSRSSLRGSNTSTRNSHARSGALVPADHETTMHQSPAGCCIPLSRRAARTGARRSDQSCSPRWASGALR